MTKQKKKSKKILDFLIFLLAVAVLILIALNLLFYQPKSYQPQTADSGEISPYITHRLGPDIYEKLQLDRPFEILIEQQGVNDILARYTWPAKTGSVTIDQPVTAIDPNGVAVMAKVRYMKIPMILTINARPELIGDPESPDSKKLVFNLQAVKAGKLPVTAIARMIIASAIEDEAEYTLRRLEAGTDDSLERIYLEKYLQMITALKPALLNNEPIDPVFPVKKGKTLRLDQIEFSKNRAGLRFSPLEE